MFFIFKNGYSLTRYKINKNFSKTIVTCKKNYKRSQKSEGNLERLQKDKKRHLGEQDKPFIFVLEKKQFLHKSEKCPIFALHSLQHSVVEKRKNIERLPNAWFVTNRNFR